MEFLKQALMLKETDIPVSQDEFLLCYHCWAFFQVKNASNGSSNGLQDDVQRQRFHKMSKQAIAKFWLLYEKDFHLFGYKFA